MSSKCYNSQEGDSWAAKRKIVQEFVDGKWKSLKEASDAHGIRGKSTLARWIRTCGFGYVLDAKGRKGFKMTEIQNEISSRDAEIRQLRLELAETREALAQMTVNDLYHINLFLIGMRTVGENPEEIKKKLISRQLIRPLSTQKMTAAGGTKPEAEKRTPKAGKKEKNDPQK